MMALILDWTLFSRSYTTVRSKFDYVEQDVLEYGMVSDDTDMVRSVLEEHRRENPTHHWTIQLLMDQLPKPDLIYFSWDEIDYDMCKN